MVVVWLFKSGSFYVCSVADLNENCLCVCFYFSFSWQTNTVLGFKVYFCLLYNFYSIWLRVLAILSEICECPPFSWQPKVAFHWLILFVLLPISRLNFTFLVSLLRGKNEFKLVFVYNIFLVTKLILVLLLYNVFSVANLNEKCVFFFFHFLGKQTEWDLRLIVIILLLLFYQLIVVSSINSVCSAANFQA